MSDALSQVEELIAATLRDWPALGGKVIATDQSKDVAPENPDNLIRIFTVAVAFDVLAGDGQTLWTATMEFESTSASQIVGTIGAENRATLAGVMAALSQDRTLGGRLQDIQEIDIASVMPNGKDLGAASLQCRVEFYTPRDDWFTLTTN